MAARRLQTEIDRILKRVREGVYEFDAVRDKLHHAASNAQKDKMEGDLKSVIKKLQRLRDQIKAWLQSSEVKDKSQLLEYRSLIETQMETFKAVEKEMKIKAFSTEGLSAVVKKDPAEEAKEESNKWLSVQVKQLARQIETTEADIEQLSASTKKGRKVSVVAKEGQVTTLKSRNVARKWHIGRLELLKRIVENGTVTPDCVETIKEDVEYFVDNNTEDELALADYDYIYDDFNLDEEEEAFGLRDTSDMNSSHDTISTVPPDDNGQNSKRRESVDESKVLVSLKDGKWAVTRKDHLKDKEKDKKPSTAKPAIIKSAEKDNTVVPPANFTKLVARAAALSPTRLNAEDMAPMSPIRYAAAAAAAVATPATLFVSVESESGSLANSSVTGPSPTMARRSSAGSAIQIRRPPFLLPSPASSHEPAVSSAASIIRAPAPVLATAADSTSVPATTGSTITSSLSVESFPFAVTSTAAATPTPATLTPTTLTVEQYPSTLTSKEGFSSVTRAPPPLAPLITNFDHDRLRQIPLLEAGSVENMDQITSALQISAQAVSDAHDNGKWRYYVPKMPYPTPAYYPQEPLPIFDSPTLYHKLDPDTLFFIFYYQQGTCHQYFAARELKRQSWRFHKQYLTWFQRHTEPIEITNEYELGTYTYFDWEGSWLKRKRSDFRFEYRWLED